MRCANTLDLCSFLHRRLLTGNCAAPIDTTIAPNATTNVETQRYDTGLKKPNRRIEKLNDILSDSQFLVPGGFSLADVAVASYLLYVVQFFPDIELHSKWPHVVRYMKECAGREAYGKAFGSNVQGFCVQRLEQMESGSGKETKMFGLF